MRRSLLRVSLVWSLALAWVVWIVLALGQMQSAQAAPAPMPLSTTWTVGGACGATIQSCIDNVSVVPGDNLFIPAGIYTENVLLHKPISLTGELSGTTIIRAAPGNYVLYISDSVTLTLVITGLTFADGSFASGGGISNNAGAPIILQNSIISNNVASALGGGLYSAGDIALTNVSFFSNTAAGHGGGAYVYTASVNGGTFERNVSGGGGGLFSAGPLALTGTQFLSNRATGERGGALWSGAGLTVANSTFLSNTAVFSDGGAVAALGPASIAGGLFRSNTSGARGGAVFAGSGLSLDSALLIANSGSSGGGAYVEAGDGYIVNSLFARNDAVTTLGSAVHSVTTGTVRLLYDTFANPTLINGRGVYAVSSTVGITDSIIAYFLQGVEGFGANVFEDYNMYYGNGSRWFNVVNGGHSFIGYPWFASPTNDDYHLTYRSPAIDEAYDIGIRVDFEGDPRPQGTAPDIGYDESPFTATADLLLSTNAVRSSAAPGQPVTFTLSISNAGPQIAHNVVLTEDVPAEVAGVAVASNIPITPLAPTTWQIGNLDPVSGGVLTLTGVFSPSLAGPTTFTNSATIASTTGDPNPANNTSSATLTLLRLAFASPSFSVHENVAGGVANIGVNLIPASSLTVSVGYSATAGTAIAGVDFSPVSGTLTFAPGQTTRSFAVPIMNDMKPEQNETVVLTLYNPQGAVFLTPSTTTLTIIDDVAVAHIYLPLIER